MISFLRDLVVRDFLLKLFSFMLALLIWIVINMAVQNETLPVSKLPLGPTEVRVFSQLPVTIMSSAEDVRSFRVSPKEIEVTIQGDPKTVKRLQSKDIRAIVDLTGIQAAHDLRKRVEVSTPAGVSHVKIDPEEVQVIFPPRS